VSESKGKKKRIPFWSGKKVMAIGRWFFARFLFFFTLSRSLVLFCGFLHHHELHSQSV
jgi:hypothetical protein